MKKLLTMCALVLAISLLATSDSKAALIGVELALPDITSDSIGTYSYNASSNLFTSSATPLSITFDGSTLINITGTRSYLVSFLVDESGNFAGGVAGNDLEIWGDIDVDGDNTPEYSGLLLSGEVDNFGWLDSGTNIDAFDFTFEVNGGALASYYAGYDKGADVMTSEDSTFTGDFTVDFGATKKTKHDTAPLVPEPTSLFLLGSGLFGLAAAGIRKKKA